jgi:hypothetical protein
MSAGTTHEGGTPIVSTDAVHSSYSVHDLFRYERDWPNLKFIDSLRGRCTNAPTPAANEGKP